MCTNDCARSGVGTAVSRHGLLPFKYRLITLYHPAVSAFPGGTTRAGMMITQDHFSSSCWWRLTARLFPFGPLVGLSAPRVHALACPKIALRVPARRYGMVRSTATRGEVKSVLIRGAIPKRQDRLTRVQCTLDRSRMSSYQLLLLSIDYAQPGSNTKRCALRCSRSPAASDIIPN